MPTRNSNIRLGTTGDEEFKRNLRAAGATGDAALDRITRGAKPASAGLKAVDVAGREARGAMDSMAASAGPLGRALSGISKTGLLAGAAIGALAIGLKKAGGIALEAVSDFDALGKTADKIGVATDALQELRFAAGSLAGFSDQQLDTSLQRLSRKMGDAARGVGEAVKIFDELDISVQNADGTMRAVDDVLDDVADRMSTMTSEQQKLSTAVKLFDTEGAGMVNVLKDAGDALDETRQRARDLGIVIDEDVIRNAEVMQDRLDTASKVIDANLKQAFIDLAPTIVDTVELLGSAARGLADFRDLIVDIEDKTSRGLDSQAQTLQASIGELEAGLRAYDEAVSTGANTLRQDLAAAAAEPLLARRLAELEEIEAEIARREAERARRETSGSSSIVQPASSGPNISEIAAISALEDAETKRKRTLEDIEVLRRAEKLALNQGNLAAERFLETERQRLAEQRAGQDAAKSARRGGGDAEAAATASIDAITAARRQRDKMLAEKDLEAQKQFNTLRAETARKAGEEELKLAQENSRKKEEQRRKDLANDKRADEEQARLDEEGLRQIEAAQERRAGAFRARDQDRALAAPVIGLAGRVGEINALEEIKALQDMASAEEDLARVRQAGADAAAAAGEFDDPEILRQIAEDRARITLEEREANEVIQERIKVLQDEVKAREQRDKLIEASQKRLASAEESAERDRSLVAPVIDLAARIDAASDLEEIDILQKKASAEEDLARVRRAGADAAAAAGEFDDPEKLRQIAENRARIALEERSATDVIRDRIALLQNEANARERLSAAEVAQERDRALAVPVISLAGRLGEANTLEELEALQEAARIEQDLVRVRQAGAAAAAAAGEFDNPERLRDIAEARARITLQERDAATAIRDKSEALRQEADARREAEEEAREYRRAEEEASRRQIDNIRQATTGLIGQARGWSNVDDAIHDVIGALDRLGAFESLFSGISGAPTAGGGGFLSNILGGLGSGISQIFGGVGSAPASSPIPFIRPRAGGGPVSAGELYRVNEFNTEFFRPDQNGQVIPLRADGGANGTAAPAPAMPSVQVTNHFNAGINGADRSAIAQQIQQSERRTIQAVADLSSRSPHYLEG